MLLPSQRSGFDDDAKNRLGKVPKGIKIFSSLFLYYRQNQNKNENENYSGSGCGWNMKAHFSILCGWII